MTTCDISSFEKTCSPALYNRINTQGCSYRPVIHVYAILWTLNESKVTFERISIVRYYKDWQEVSNTWPHSHGKGSEVIVHQVGNLPSWVSEYDKSEEFRKCSCKGSSVWLNWDESDLNVRCSQKLYTWCLYICCALFYELYYYIF